MLASFLLMLKDVLNAQQESIHCQLPVNVLRVP